MPDWTEGLREIAESRSDRIDAALAKMARVICSAAGAATKVAPGAPDDMIYDRVGPVDYDEMSPRWTYFRETAIAAMFALTEELRVTPLMLFEIIEADSSAEMDRAVALLRELAVALDLPFDMLTEGEWAGSVAPALERVTAFLASLQPGEAGE